MMFGFIAGLLWFAAGYVFRGITNEGNSADAFVEGYERGREDEAEAIAKEELRDREEASILEEGKCFEGRP